jgi:hypothetical protein
MKRTLKQHWAKYGQTWVIIAAIGGITGIKELWSAPGSAFNLSHHA